MGGSDRNLSGVEVNSGGAEEARTPDPLLANRITLDSYLNSLKVRNCSDKYIGANKRFLATLVARCPVINQESALQYLGTFNNIGANSRARYGGMLIRITQSHRNVL